MGKSYKKILQKIINLRALKHSAAFETI